MVNLNTAVYEKTFREKFPEFEPQYREIDRLGGKSCKSCNIRPRNKQIRQISSKLATDPKFINRWASFSGQTVSNPKTSLPLMCRDYFERSFLFEDVRNFVREEVPELSSELLKDIAKRGYFHSAQGKHYSALYGHYRDTPDFRKKLDRILIRANIKSKLSYNSPRYKVLSGSTLVDLENQVNEFCADKRVVSVDISGLSAIVSFHLIQSGVTDGTHK